MSMIAADEKLIALMTRWERSPLKGLPEATTYVREQRTHLEPADWRVGYLSVSDRERPPEVWSDLNEVTPQALLRDLHRPVRSTEPVERERHDIPTVGELARVRAEILAAMEDHRFPDYTPASRFVSALCEVRSRWVSEPWQPYLDDEAPRREVHW